MKPVSHTYLRIICLIICIAITQACSIKESNVDLMLRTAENENNTGHFYKAEQVLLKIIDSADMSNTFNYYRLAALTMQADCYLQDNKYEDAILISDKALHLCDEIYGSKDPLRTSILFTLASAQIESKHLSEGGTTYKNIIAQSQTSLNSYAARCAIPYIRLGDIELQQNHLDKAIQYYERVNSIQTLNSPIEESVVCRLALCYVILGNDNMAEFYFKKMSLNPTPMNVSFSLIMNTYIQFLTAKNRNSEALAIKKIITNWNEKHQSFCKWLAARGLSPNSRFTLIGKYIDKDFAHLNQCTPNKLYVFPINK